MKVTFATLCDLEIPEAQTAFRVMIAGQGQTKDGGRSHETSAFS